MNSYPISILTTESFPFEKASDFDILCSSSDSFTSEYILPKSIMWDGGLFNDSDDASDRARAVAVDSERNIILTGYSFSPKYTHLPIVKYTPDGNLLWNKSITSINNSDIGYGLLTDSSNSIYLIGSPNSYSDDAFLWKFTSTGDMLWNCSFGGADLQRPRDVSFDSADNIIMAGETWEFLLTHSRQGFICKFDSSGEQIWNHTFGGISEERIEGLVVDSTDSIYVVGNRLQSSDRVLIVYKFSSTGQLIWNQTIFHQDECWGRKITISSDDKHLYFAGCSYQLADNTWSAFVGKLASSTGQLLWSNIWQGLFYAEAYDLALSNDDNLIVAGITQSTTGKGLEIFLNKYSHKTGQILWSYTWGGLGLDDCSALEYAYSEETGERYYLAGETNSFGQEKEDMLLLLIYDSDLDGLTDEWELVNGTDPLNSDTDFDGLDDFLEIDRYSTDPLDPDSDDDGWFDGKEVDWGTDPLNPKSTPQRRKLILSITIPGGVTCLMLIVILPITHYKRKRSL